jgi:peptide/nickel transport system ATP-binding protein
VTLSIEAGSTVGLVGESGCGKSTLARSVVGLVPFGGTLRLDGLELRHAKEMSTPYRRAVQIVFQHPDLSLNPRMAVGKIVGRPIRLYERLRGRRLQRRVADLLERVHLPADYARRYSHELSGGEKQRVAIARAFAPQPRLVICDEITSGLDVSVQASILNLLVELQDAYATAYLFISHDLNLVQHIADRIAVMYLGNLVELRDASGGPLTPPFHPYTEALLSAVPVPEPTLEARRVRLQGPLPSPKSPPPGCPFSSRCPRKLGDLCEREAPPLAEVAPGHYLACHLPPAELAAVPPIWRPVSRPASVGDTG